MNWKDILFIQLKLDAPGPHLLIDKSGILLDKSFLNYLNFKNLTFNIYFNLSELIRSDIEAFDLIICDNLVIPSLFSEKANVTIFSKQDIPFNINFHILKSLSSRQIVQILDYLSEQNLYLTVNESNIDTVLSKADNYSIQIDLESYKKDLYQILNKVEMKFHDILELGVKWGKLIYLWYQRKCDIDFELQNKVDNSITDFALSPRFKSIFYAINPVSVDKIISNIQTKNHPKTALLCFDCMGVAEWELLKEYLNDFLFKESFVFALIPTITSVSRSAIFTGDYERSYQSKSINEPKELQTRFPENKHLFCRQDDEISDKRLSGIDFITVIFNFFDEIAHATIMPPGITSKELYYNSVKDYLKYSDIKSTFKTLLNNGFHIFLCSDHGSVLARGNGNRIQKWLLDNRARRACWGTESSLLELVDYPKFDIPFIKDKKVILAPDRTMFDHVNARSITHGGITLDELIVPYVEVINK